MHKPSVCLISSGINASNLRLQPWRYLHEVARQLTAQGHAVSVLSDGASTLMTDELEGVMVQRIPSVASTALRPNHALDQALQTIGPDVLLWHVGTTSFLPHRSYHSRGPSIGIFTSPMYGVRDLARLGLRRLARGYKLSAMHMLGASVPGLVLRRGVAMSGLRRLVVQTRTTRDQLVDHGVRASMIDVIAPGVDPAWEQPGLMPRHLREQLGFTPSDAVVVYFGSPAPLRGLHTLLRAVAIARREEPRLKLLVLSRRRADELIKEDAELAHLLGQDDAQAYVKVVSGFLPEDELVQHVAAADLVALPFEIIPSDAPLSILEAQALGKPIVVTTVGCLAELAVYGPTYLAQPADPASLASALQRAVADRQRMVPERDQDQRVLPNRSWRDVGVAWSQLVEHL